MQLVLLSLLLTVVTVIKTATPPETWKENWYEHTQLLTRVHLDDDVAVYYDPDMDKSLTWIPSFYSKLWKYAKKVYGKYSNDPILYGIFHAEKYSGCHATNYYERLKAYKNVIDCGLLEKGRWNRELDIDYDLIAGSVSILVQICAHGVRDNPAFAITGHFSDHIVVYDFYVGLNRTKDAERWRKNQLTNKGGFPRADTYWFRDWFLPIYENHGGSAVLNRFFELMAKYLPKSNTGSFNRPVYTRDMTYGEFFHFWSGASGKNLKQLATKAFGWSPKYEKELLKAQEDFPDIKYNNISNDWQEDWFGHKENLSLHFSNNQVAIYFDQDMDKSITWINKFVSDVWAHLRKVYGGFGTDPVLYATFHGGRYEGGRHSTYFETPQKNWIDCGRQDNNVWKLENYPETDLILDTISSLVENSAHGVQNSPAYSLWTWTFKEIFMYDVYASLNRTDDANRWYDVKLLTYKNFPKPKTYWFRDWFVPIYEQYDGSNVLNQFFLLLSKYFPKENDKYSRDMNLGEFVHFWSGAAQINLKGLAREAFGWNEGYEKQYKQASKDFSEITYHNIILL